MFKKEVAERAARVMGNVIRGPISKKDHELLQSYLKGPRQLSPQVLLRPYQEKKTVFSLKHFSPLKLFSYAYECNFPFLIYFSLN